MKVHFQIQNDLFTQKEEPFGGTVKVMLMHLLLSFSVQNLLKNPYFGCKAEIWRPGLESTYRDPEIQYIFQVPRCKFSHQAKKSQYQSIMQFFIPKQRNFFFCCC